MWAFCLFGSTLYLWHGSRAHQKELKMAISGEWGYPNQIRVSLKKFWGCQKFCLIEVSILIYGYGYLTSSIWSGSSNEQIRPPSPFVRPSKFFVCNTLPEYFPIWLLGWRNIEFCPKKIAIPNLMTYINVKSNFEALWVKKWLEKFVRPTVAELWLILCFLNYWKKY